MSDEIKEILEEIIDEKRTDRFGRIMFEISKGKQLLDYITNLQQENEQLEKIADSRMNTILDIEKCIEKLKENNNE